MIYVSSVTNAVSLNVTTVNSSIGDKLQRLLRRLRYSSSIVPFRIRSTSAGIRLFRFIKSCLAFPSSIRMSMGASSPFSAAKCSGVCPSSVAESTAAKLLRSILAVAAAPARTAYCSSVQWQKLRALTLAWWAMGVSAMSGVLRILANEGQSFCWRRGHSRQGASRVGNRGSVDF